MDQKQKIDYSKIYSPYKMSMFEQCPKSYHFYYLDPIYGPMKSDLKRQPENIWPFNTLGKAVHNAITLFYHLPPIQRTEENLLAQLESTWSSEAQWNKKPPLGKWGGFKTLEEERDYYAQAILMLKKFIQIANLEPEIEYLPTNDLKNSISDYTGLIKPLNESFDVSGKFDLVVKNQDGSCHVVDFKTGKREKEEYFQLRFYKLLAEENFRKPVKKASFYFLKMGNQKEFDLEKEETEEIKKEVLEKINQIVKTEDFEAKPSKLCQFCLYKNFCPKKGKVKELTEELVEEDYTDDLPF